MTEREISLEIARARARVVLSRWRDLKLQVAVARKNREKKAQETTQDSDRCGSCYTGR